ncbi:hypothetical protein Cni_G11775 [Canna indica]|uniref:Protein kinase domain-containing protein n=1 Tax=Canna indica TaxID=4628 RepID=A0AAQ3K6Z6_9LILI|nr:hypothetical protein Cni_G11775 [Canna indica]
MRRLLRVVRLVVVVALWCATASVAAQSLSSASDLAGLYSIRASLGLRARDWPRREDPCTSWAGVACNAAGRVVALNVSGLRRTRLGRVNPQFAVDGLKNLTQLGYFNATGFALPGPIPDLFGRELASTLTVLVLREAAVFGSIPFSLGSAAGLTVLNLAGNHITGNIPPTLGQLGNLTLLDLSHNSLSGAVLTSFGTLSNLSYLDLSSNFITGSVPLALGTLRNLKTLILANNSLTGSVPAQLGDLSLLAVLDLSFNSLSGLLPDDLKNLRNLQDLNLDNNSLSGALADSIFAGLSKLRSITLSHNNFSGALPDSLWSHPQLQVFNVSYNNLTGVLPDLVPAVASGLIFDISNNRYYGSISSGFESIFAKFSVVDVSGNYLEGALPFQNMSKNVSFRLNCFQDATDQRSPGVCLQFYSEKGLPYDGNITPSTGPTSNTSKKSHGNLKYILVGTLVGAFVLAVLVFLLVCCLKRSGGRKIEQQESAGDAALSTHSGGGAQASGVYVSLSAVGEPFSYEQLVRATSNFSDTNLIKHGHSGDIYRGSLERGIPIVVKRMDVQKFRKDAPAAELDLFSKGLHERLVPFLGYCLENEKEKFLVYKYVPNADLYAAMQRKPELEEGLQSLDWIKRLKIATGIAEALCYLHDCSPPLVHRDIQATSILLDDKFEVRLGSLSEVCAQEGEAHQNVITRLLRISQTSEQGISGPPATCAYDVYCFGKVLLELVTGKLGISRSNDAATNEWLDYTLPYINAYEKELVTKIVDPFLVVDEDHLEEVWAMAIVAKSCLHPKPNKRPPVKYILKALENPLKVVREDNNSGSARLRATSSRGSWNAAFMGSWRRSSSEIASVPGQLREDQILKRSGTSRSQGSGGEQSFSRKRPSKEIFPEPSGLRDIED